MQLLKVLFLLIVLVAVIEAQKGGTKSKQRPANVPPPPSPRKTPQQPQPQQPTKRPQPQRPQPQRPQEDDSGSAGNGIEESEGESGPEPPAVVPQTSFTCDDKPYQPGMYADMEVDCSVYHMCFDGRKESFLCGTGTMFNQEILSCDHPVKVNCANSPQFYEANTELGKPGAEPGNDGGSKGSGQAPQPQQPRPRINQPSKTSPQRPRPQPQPQPRPAPAPQPFADDEPDDEPEAPAPAPAPVPAPAPRRSKTSPKKPAPRPTQPKPSPQPRKTPIVQSYDDNEGESNVRRAYRARY